MCNGKPQNGLSNEKITFSTNAFPKFDRQV